MEDTNDDKIIKGKMISCAGSEFDVFLMKNMSLFIGYNIVFILPPYNNRRALNNGFNEDNSGKYEDQEQQQLYSFFQGTENFSFHYLEMSKIIKYFINDENDKIELHLPSKDITIQEPIYAFATTTTQKLTITSETTPQDVYSQLGIVVHQQFPEQNKEKRKKNNKEEKSGTLDKIDIKRDKNNTFQKDKQEGEGMGALKKRINQENKNKSKINPEINNIDNLNQKNEKKQQLKQQQQNSNLKSEKNSQSSSFWNIFNWCNCCNFEEEKKAYELNNNTMNNGETKNNKSINNINNNNLNANDYGMN